VNELDLSEDVPGESEATVGGTTFRRGDSVTLRLEGRSDPYDRILDGRPATVERSTSITTTGSTSASRWTTTRAAADARDGPVPVLLRRRDRARRGVVNERHAQILIAESAIPGCATTASEARSCAGSGSASTARLVTIDDFGTGGLDLAYEVMRGYDALILIDVMRGGGPPGTLYVLEPEEGEIAGASRTARSSTARDGPADVLRFVRAVSGCAAAWS